MSKNLSNKFFFFKTSTILRQKAKLRNLNADELWAFVFCSFIQQMALCVGYLGASSESFIIPGQHSCK